MKYRNVMNRRTLLRGAGSVAIALPFLDEMNPKSAWGAPMDAPVRAITIFFGLGVPKQVAATGWDGPLAPLGVYSDRLAMVRGVNLLDGSPGSGGNHFQGGGAVFTGIRPQTNSQTGGPSIDQVIMRNFYPDGPPTLINTLLAGSFFRRGTEATRYVHCWRDDGAPVDLPIELPTDLFDRVFGQENPGIPEGPDELKARNYTRSVLDTVLEDYEKLTGNASNLGAGSKQRVKDHLDQIRELEQRIFGEALDCANAMDPGDLPLLHGQPVDPDGAGIDLNLDEFETLWHVHAELFALAFKCDAVRFGNITHQSGGERIRLHGDYYWQDQLIESFDDDTTTHEYWHQWDQGGNAPYTYLMEQHTHFIMAQIAYVLEQLDDPNYLDANGQTILDNTFLMISTELGDGGRHDLESVFHAVGPAGGCLNVGQIIDVNATDADLYNTCLTGLGVDEQMGDLANYNGDIDQLLP